ncbi:hypothetical protein EDD11_006460 [Mortierella claussenii]|nr:hypothetical protein EDD11_006460 [Mortierella claussenii]
MDADDGSTIRLIMVYTRSDVLPTIPDLEVVEPLYASGRFFYDCIYMHQKASEVTGPVKPQHVYDRLTEMEDARSPGYYYELTRVLKKYCAAMAELLAHPSVRPIQDMHSTKMAPPPSVRRMEEMEQQQQELHLEQAAIQQQQHQHQQQGRQQPHIQVTQPSAAVKRSDSFKNPETMLAGNVPIQKPPPNFFASPSAPPSTATPSVSSRPPPARPLPAAPVSASSSSPTGSPYSASVSMFASSKDYKRPSPSASPNASRAKLEMLPSTTGPSGKAEVEAGTGIGTTGGGSATGLGTNGSISGGGTGLDDAILL